MKLNFPVIFLASMLMLVFLALAGCASKPPIDLRAAPDKEFMSAYATLSDSNNPADIAASVVSTKLAMYRRLAVKKLKAGAITVDEANNIQKAADSIRSGLKVALASGDLNAIKMQSDWVNSAYSNLEGEQ